MKAYQQIVERVLQHGTRKASRTGVDTLSTFNVNYEVDLAEGFPLLTTKLISWKNIVIENLWFLSGETNIDFLRHYGVKFWDAWADAEGEVPSAYGNFWRHFPVHGPDDAMDRVLEQMKQLPRDLLRRLEVRPLPSTYNDQIKWAVETLKRDPMSRRVVVSAWAPGNAQISKLPPCHAMFVLNVQNEEDRDGWVNARLNLHLTQRSADIALGVPYNIAGYAFILSLFSRFTGIPAGVFAHTMIDAHVYTSKPDGSMAEYDHVPGLIEQNKRTPRSLPKLTIDPSITCLEDVRRIIDERPPVEKLLELFKLEGYDPRPAIYFKVAV